MILSRILGIMVIIPISIFLMVSYFVLFANRKVESEKLKQFGQIVAALLWISAGLIGLGGLYMVATGKHPLITYLQYQMKQGGCPMMGRSMMHYPMMPDSSRRHPQMEQQMMQRPMMRQPMMPSPLPRK